METFTKKAEAWNKSCDPSSLFVLNSNFRNDGSFQPQKDFLEIM